MNTRQLFLSFLLWFIPFVLSGQRYISGHITDAENGNPIPGASVFIANTTAGTTTDTTGYYQLKIPGEGSYRLAVSHVGYQPVFKDIEPGKTAKILDVTMHTREMEDVTVALTVKARKRDKDLFWASILGKEPSPKTIYATNPEAAYFYYNSSSHVLTVTSRVPLQIVNKETGYHIQFVLNRFTHDYRTRISSWDGEGRFRKLEPENDRQKINWEINRAKIYRVSINYFIKALYNNSLLENGFLLTDPGESALIGQPLRKFYWAEPETFLSPEEAGGGKKLYIPEYSHLMLVCFGKLVTDRDLGNARFAQNGKKRWEAVGLYRNMLETPNDQVRIFPDGTHTSKLLWESVFSSNSQTGLDMILPIDYLPDIVYGTVSPVVAADDAAKVPQAVAGHQTQSLADALSHTAKHFGSQLNIFPQEKVYLHTDKPYYISGERIWFRAHVVNAASHKSVSDVYSIYAELFDARDSIVSRVKINHEDYVFSGYIPIPADVPEGNYTIRAYTNSMRNLDEDYFFMKNIHIGDPMNRVMQAIPNFKFTSNRKIDADIRFSSISPLSPITPESVKISINDRKSITVKNKDGISNLSFNLSPDEKKRVILLDVMHDQHPYRQYLKVPLPDDDFDVSFYPEGGSALQGCMGRIAFKAMQRDGTEIDVNGVVYDWQGNEITQFKTSVCGMGQFMMKPEQGKKYYAVCTNHRGQSKRFDLPVTKEDGYALSATWLKDSLMVKVSQSKFGKTADTLCLIVHTRGMVQDVRIWENTSKSITFHKDFFPSGVSNLLLLTKDMTPVSERLVFSNNDDQPNVTGKADRDTCSTRSLVEYTVNITDNLGNPLQGNISVSITDDREVITDTTANILTTLLLTSDVRGNIPDPAFYFQKNTRSKHALDLLMLTQGWRRYDTERIVRNNFMRPDSLLEKGYEISGTVKSRSLTSVRPVENVDIDILSLKGNYIGKTFTDRNGRFYLHDGEALDSTWFILQTAPQSDERNLKLTLDKASYPARMIPVIASGALDRNVFAKYADKAEQQHVDEHGTRVVHSSESAIIAQKKSAQKSNYYHTPDDSITKEQLDSLSPSSLNELLIRLPGLIVTKTDRFSDCGSILWLINDYPVMSTVKLKVDEIERIDILTSPANLIAFGEWGKCGAIAIHIRAKNTRSVPLVITGYFNIISSYFLQSDIQEIDALYKDVPYIKRIMPLGFQKPAEFYAPKYDMPTQNTKPDLRTTIHWQPSLTTDKHGTASFNFYTADVPSTYTVVIEGVTDDGKIVYKRDQIVVGEK